MQTSATVWLWSSRAPSCILSCPVQTSLALVPALRAPRGQMLQHLVNVTLSRSGCPRRPPPRRMFSCSARHWRSSCCKNTCPYRPPAYQFPPRASADRGGSVSEYPLNRIITIRVRAARRARRNGSISRFMSWQGQPRRRQSSRLSLSLVDHFHAIPDDNISPSPSGPRRPKDHPGPLTIPAQDQPLLTARVSADRFMERP